MRAGDVSLRISVTLEGLFKKTTFIPSPEIFKGTVKDKQNGENSGKRDSTCRKSERPQRVSDQLRAWPCGWVAVTMLVSGSSGKVGMEDGAQSCKISLLAMKRSLVVWSFVFSKVHLDASKGFLSGKRGDQVYVFLISLWQLLIWLVSEFRSRGVRQGANTGMQKRTDCGFDNAVEAELETSVWIPFIFWMW